MTTQDWTLDTGHATAPGSGFEIEVLAALGATGVTGGGGVVALIAAGLAAGYLDHLFGPSVQRPLGPRRRHTD